MLGPRPGAKKRANKLNVSGLGRSLVNQQKKERKNQVTSDRHTTDVNPYGSESTLKSVTEQQPLDEMLSTAELAGKDFTTERTAAIRVISTPAGAPSQLSKAERDQLIQQHYDNAGKLTVPRRPRWSRDMTATELDRLEKEAFLAWRRSLASLQENPQLRLALTPFERNIEVWRQLWRVLERSHLVVQIVDARNPLLYRSEDLDSYVRSFGNKKHLLLINKADLLTASQREAWREYLLQNEIPFAFFSAKQSSADNLESTEKSERQDDVESDNEVDSENESEVESDSEDKADIGDADKETSDKDGEIQLENTPLILSVDQLESLFRQAAPELDEEDSSKLQIGLVGYPNVGKSSTINALIGAKKVSVSATPGKTKHFQTINLTDDLMLCDCPGLVFPNFAQTKAELVCQGVLPIDQLRDYMTPSQLVVERIPSFFLERTYHVKLHTDPVTALDLLETYAAYRGFTRTGGGTPDASRSARIVLKDYVNAKLPFCMPPPNYEDSPQEFNRELYEIIDRETASASEQTAREPTDEQREADKIARLQLEDSLLEEELDRGFFSGERDRGTASLPFHLRNSGAQGGKASKKHNKGRKGRN